MFLKLFRERNPTKKYTGRLRSDCPHSMLISLSTVAAAVDNIVVVYAVCVRVSARARAALDLIAHTAF